MYTTIFERGNNVLTSLESGENESLFSHAHTRLLIDTLLTRKQRNNGVGRSLASELRNSGAIQFFFQGTLSRKGLGFAFKKLPAGMEAFQGFLLGDEPEALLKRLNRSRTLRNGLEFTQSERALRRALRAQGIYQQKPKPVPSVAGANGSLCHHFKNSTLTLYEAMRAIAYALKVSVERVRELVMKSLKKHAGIATIRVSRYFVFRINFLNTRITPELLVLDTPVTLWSTKDNDSQAYRRLRKKLKLLLDCESKARKRNQEIQKEVRQWRRVNRILCA